MAEQPKKISRSMAAPTGVGSQRKPAAPAPASVRAPAAATSAPASRRLVTGSVAPRPAAARAEPTARPAPSARSAPPTRSAPVEPAFEEESLFSEEEPLAPPPPSKQMPAQVPVAAQSGKSARSTVYIPPRAKVKPEAEAAPAAPPATARNTGSTVIKPRAAQSGTDAGSQASPRLSSGNPRPVGDSVRVSGAKTSGNARPSSASFRAGSSSRSSRNTDEADENTGEVEASSQFSAEPSAAHAAEYSAGPSQERSSRRSTKRGGQSERKPEISKKKLIVCIAGPLVALLCVLAVLLGYKPYMRSSYIATLSSSDASTDARKSAADALLKDFTPEAFSIFSAKDRLCSENAGVREAAAYGLEIVARQDARPVACVVEALGSAQNKESKLLYVKTLINIGDGFRKNSKDTSSFSEEGQKKIGASLIASSSPKESETEVRLAAVDGLRDFRFPGICVHLLKLAETEKGSLRERALSAVKVTAQPDAIGDLLKAMQSQDKDFAAVAKEAFSKVRESAKSEELLKMINDPSVDVRREIIEALCKRKMDVKAAEAMTTAALNDKELSLQIKAISALPTTGINGSAILLKPLMTHADETLRIAMADTLGQLRDADSYKMVLEAFTLNFAGPTLDAYTKALGKRSFGRDLKACDILIHLFGTAPAAQKTICDALLLVTNNGVGKSRDAIRGAWDAAKWKGWYAHLLEREKIRTVAKENLEALRKKIDYPKKEFIKLRGLVEVEMNQLEKCQEMCKPDDLEDITLFEKEMLDYSVLKMHFSKNASVE